MIDRFLSQTSFSSQEDFVKNLKIHVPDNFNFGYDIVDAWAAEQPDKPALLWTNDKGEHHQFSFADMKQYTDRTASYFQSLGIGHGDMVMLILKRRYEFWFSIIALHKLGGSRYSGYTPANQERHCIPLQCSRHKNDCGCRRRSGHQTHNRCYAGLSYCKAFS